MQARDIMVSPVVTIPEYATVQEAAKLMASHRISGLPVVDGNGAVVGILSEGDLLFRHEIGTERHRSWASYFWAPSQTLATEFVAANSRRVADVMTRRPVTVSSDTSVYNIATLFEKHGIKRVPVVENGKLVGIVSRGNLVQAIARFKDEGPSVSDHDAELRQRILAGLRSHAWANIWLLNVTVSGGIVELWGQVASEAEQKAVRTVVENTPGVMVVDDNLSIRPILMEA